VWTIVLAVVVLALVIAALFTWPAARSRRATVGAIIGAAAGAMGAFLILRPEVDLVPDAAEGIAIAILIVLGTVGLGMITWLRWTRG
jgi:hypothetical protein